MAEGIVTREEVLTLVDEVRRAFPGQEIAEADLPNWRTVLGPYRYSECLVAVAVLRHLQASVSPEDIKSRVWTIRKQAAEPSYRPGGEAWEQNIAAHGAEYEGGPVCWDPRVACEGICKVCPVAA